MTTYTSVFGSETIPPSQNGYAAVVLTADTTFYWPELASGSNLMADIMEVTPTAAWTMTFPAANGVSTGRDVLVRNLGSFTITIHDSAGGTIGTVAAGVAKYLYITDNSTAAGAWTVFTFGTGTSAADAATLAGYGLVATGSTLSQQALTISSAVTTTVTASQRAETLIFTNSGVVTCNMPTAASAGNGFFINISNQGTGTVTIDPSGVETIDGATTKDLAPGESLTAVCSGTAWASIGYGRSTQFQFTKLVLDISTGSPFTLTSAQAANKLIQTIGTITAGVTINVPAVVAVYYVECSHTGAFTTTIKTAAGTGVALASGDRSILYCDGVNVVAAQTASAPAANLSGGVAGALVYQSAVGVTGFSAAGTAGNVAISGGTGSPTWSDLGLITHAYSAKTPIVDADEFPLADSAAAYGPKRTLWSTIKAVIGYSAPSTSKATPVDADSLPLFDSAAATTATKLTWANLKTTLSASLPSGEQSLTNYYLPSLGSAYQDKYRSGELPYCFNQQWGGAQWGMLPDGSFGSVATGNVQDDSTINITGVTTGVYAAQQFAVSESLTNPVIWVKAYKFGNPTATFTVSVRANSGGQPTGSDLMSASIQEKVVTSKTDGEWYPFQMSGTLSGNTAYHIVCIQGASSGSDYIVLKQTLNRKYPLGAVNTGTATPTWTSYPGSAMCFLIQNPAANSIIQSGGMFDQKLAFNPGNPWNQSRMTGSVLANYWDGVSCTYLHRGTYAANTSVVDYCYGIDHDRFTLTINGSGFPVFTIMRSDRTAYTITGASSVTSGNHDVGFRLRTAGDGADYATLLVDGVSVGTPLTAQTFTMDANFAKLGTRITGGGFGLAPTWTNDSQFTALASTLGWSTNGTLSASESTVMSIQNGKQYQNKNAFGSADTFYYSRTTPTVFVNATGWAIPVRLRVPSNTNTTNQYSVYLAVYDGTKEVEVYFQEYFVQIVSGGVTYTVQMDCKTYDNVFVLQGKLSDAYLFANGKLIWDGTGTLTTSAGGVNNIRWGDASATAGENADVIWSYVKYYQGGMILPTANTGTCSEFAHWSGDKSALFPSLWNSGSPVSVRQLCGVPRNYQYEQVVQREVRQGVTPGSTYASGTPVVVPDLEAYMIGALVSATIQNNNWNSAAGNGNNSAVYLDGKPIQPNAYAGTSAPSASYAMEQVIQAQATSPIGLRKVEGREWVSGGTGTHNANARTLIVEARS